MKKMIQRCGALGVLGFAVFSMIGADTGCNPWTSELATNANGAADCCPAGSQHYACSLQVGITNVQIMNDPGPAGDVRCFTPPAPPCATSQAEAEKSVQAAAQVYYSESGSKIMAVQTVQCAPVGGCVQSGSGLDPQDEPGACNVIVQTGAGGGAGGGAPASCGMQNDYCTEDSDCCTGVCSLNACQLADMQYTPPHEHFGAGGAGGDAP